MEHGEELVWAHHRAVDAVRQLAPGISNELADEVVTSIAALVFETLKQYLSGENTCN